MFLASGTGYSENYHQCTNALSADLKVAVEMEAVFKWMKAKNLEFNPDKLENYWDWWMEEPDLGTGISPTFYKIEYLLKDWVCGL